MRTDAALNLIDIFQSLQAPTGSSIDRDSFTALPIPGHARHRLGRDSNGGPVLLIAAADEPGPMWSAPIILEHLKVQSDILCRISEPDGSVEEGRFSVVRCGGGDRNLYAYFLHVTTAVVSLLGPTPSRADVASAIDHLVELFRAISSVPRKSIQGLWAELFLMARLRSPAPVVAAWHTLPDDRYDFSAGNQRIEVKSATGRLRQHYFALEQLMPPAETHVLIASLLVERAGAGVSLAELIDQVRSRIRGSADLLLHIDQVVSLTLGESWRSALEECFDREQAEKSLAFFDAASIPSVSTNLPPGVSDVRFRADLTGIPSADLGKHRARGGLFKNALRR